MKRKQFDHKADWCTAQPPLEYLIYCWFRSGLTRIQVSRLRNGAHLKKMSADIDIILFHYIEILKLHFCFIEFLSHTIYVISSGIHDFLLNMRIWYILDKYIYIYARVKILLRSHSTSLLPPTCILHNASTINALIDKENSKSLYKIIIIINLNRSRERIVSYLVRTQFAHTLTLFIVTTQISYSLYHYIQTDILLHLFCWYKRSISYIHKRSQVLMCKYLCASLPFTHGQCLCIKAMFVQSGRSSMCDSVCVWCNGT